MCHRGHIGGQRTASRSKFSLYVVWFQTQVIKLGGRYLYPLSHLGSPIITSEPHVGSLGTMPYLHIDKIMLKG